MWSSTLVRVGGVAAVIASLLVATQQVLAYAAGGGGVVAEGVGESALHTAQMLFMVFGVVGIGLAQQRRAGVFAQVAVLVAVTGCVAMYGAALTEVTVLPSLVETGSPLAQTAPAALDLTAMISFSTWIAGLLLLAVAVLVTKVLPWPAAALLGGGIVLGMALQPVLPAILLVYAVGFGWLGVAAFRTAGRPAGSITAASEPESQGHTAVTG